MENLHVTIIPGSLHSVMVLNFKNKPPCDHTERQNSSHIPFRLHNCTAIILYFKSAASTQEYAVPQRIRHKLRVNSLKRDARV